MASSSDDFSWWEVLFIIVIGLALVFGVRWLVNHKKEQISCIKGKFTVCVGDTEKFGVPTCYDFPLDKYTYKRYDDHLVVINKEVSSDVVNYPNKQLISAAKSGCKD